MQTDSGRDAERPPLREIDRMEFFKRSAKVAGAVLAAGTLGWLAGCGSGAATVEQQGSDQSSSASSQAPPQSQQQQDQSTGSAAAPDCHFYRDGTCQKTGRPCTNCIAD